MNPRALLDPWAFSTRFVPIIVLAFGQPSPAEIEPSGRASRTDPLGTWTELGPMPITNAEFGAATIGDRIYLAGGFADEDALLIYDPATDAWSQGADLPNGNHHPGAQGFDGRLYVIGGHDTESMVQIYDPATDRWSRGADLPIPTRAQATAVLEGRIHSIGGTVAAAGGVGTRDHQAYDPVADAWEVLAPLREVREHGYAGVIDGKIYFAAGREIAFVARDDLQIYDPERDRWTFGAPLLEATSGHVVQVVGGRLFALGGELVRAETVLDQSQVYDPALDQWSLLEPIPIPLHGAGSAVLNDSIYVFGGASVVEASSTGIDRVFRFDPPIVQAPTALKTRTLNSGKVRLKWKFAPRKSDATAIEIQIRAGEADFATEATVGPKVKKLVVANLAPGTHFFRARSTGPSGASAWSDEVSAVVPD